MVATERKQGGSVTYVLRPDRSLSWRGNLQFLGLISVVSLSIAGWFTWHGAWLILPFAGLELAALGTALYLVSVRGLDVETVLIDGDRLEICKGRWQIESKTCLQRCWAQVKLVPARHHWYPSRLMIRSHGKVTEIGSFLADDEKQHLARELMRNV
jgi:uncharacterized membrane protein